MSSELTPILSSIIALSGVIGGSFITYFMNYKNKTREFEHQLRRERYQEKRNVYSKFLSEVNIAVTEILGDESCTLSKLSKSTGMLAEVELLGSDEVYKRAKALSGELLNIYTRKFRDKAEAEPSLAELRERFVRSAKGDLSDSEEA